jgi:hypothetical protein
MHMGNMVIKMSLREALESSGCQQRMCCGLLVCSCECASYVAPCRTAAFISLSSSACMHWRQLHVVGNPRLRCDHSILKN